MGGAAAVGLLFMIMHLRFVFDPLFVPGSADSISPSIWHFGLLFDRRNGGEKAPEPSMASSHKGKEKIKKKSTWKVKTSTTKGVYPAERIKLKWLGFGSLIFK